MREDSGRTSFGSCSEDRCWQQRGKGNPRPTPQHVSGDLGHLQQTHTLTNTHMIAHSKQKSTPHIHKYGIPNTHKAINTIHTEHTQTLTLRAQASLPATKPYKKFVHTTHTNIHSHTHRGNHTHTHTHLSHIYLSFFSYLLL